MYETNSIDNDLFDSVWKFINGLINSYKRFVLYISREKKYKNYKKII